MMARRPTLIAALFGVWSLTFASAVLAGETKVAVAANFTEPAKAIAAHFKVRTGHDAVLSFGSSGQFYTQIANGAPYEVFLSADVERPQKAEVEGLAVTGSRFTYATGRLVLFSRTPGLVDGRGAVLSRGGFSKLAIADPKAAPYGQEPGTFTAWEGIEPMDEVGGLDAALLGPLSRLLGALEHHWRALDEPATPTAWGERLRALLLDVEQAREHQEGDLLNHGTGRLRAVIPQDQGFVGTRRGGERVR